MPLDLSLDEKSGFDISDDSVTCRNFGKLRGSRDLILTPTLLVSRRPFYIKGPGRITMLLLMLCTMAEVWRAWTARTYRTMSGGCVPMTMGKAE